ncbi:MAG: HD domain-containing protein [Candidatus Anammoxibacter sp.]
MNIPTHDKCLNLLNKNKIPDNIIAHSEAVCRFAEELVGRLISKGVNVNKELVIAAALLHDIEKLNGDHVINGWKLVSSLGYPEVADIVKRHGLRCGGGTDFTPLTIEDKIVFYADKRVLFDKTVSLEERLMYIAKNYNIGNIKEMEAFCRKIERQLYGLCKLTPTTDFYAFS